MGSVMTVYGFVDMIQELLDQALNELEPDAFEKLLDSVSVMLQDYED